MKYAFWIWPRYQLATSLAIASLLVACVQSAEQPQSSNIGRITQKLEQVVFFDDFSQGLSQWQNMGSNVFNTESLHDSDGYPSDASGSPAAHADNCDTECSLVLLDAIDLSQMSSATLSFLRFVDWTLDANDYLAVDLFDGNDWNNNVFYWTGGDGDDDRWHSESLDLSNYLGASSFSIRIRSKSNWSWEHVHIDDLRVVGEKYQDRNQCIGPFAITGNYSQATFYLVSQGMGESVLVHVEAPDQTPGAKWDRALVRVFDPQERLTNWSFTDHLETGGDPEVTTDVAPVDGPISLSEPGVYQVRVSARGTNSRVRLDVPEGIQYGVSFQNGRTDIKWCTEGSSGCGTTQPQQPDEIWAWAPAHDSAAMYLQLDTENPLPTISRLEGSSLVPVSPVEMGSDRYRYVVQPEAGKDGELWKFDFGSQDRWLFTPSGMPLILCNSQEAATAIHASVERVPSGPYAGALVSHRFQLDIAELMPEILANIGTEDLFDGAAADGSPIATYPERPECSDPTDIYDLARHLDLLRPYDSGLAQARWALGSFPFDDPSGQPLQVTSAANFWAGTVGTPFWGKQSCEDDMDCVNGSPCSDGICSDPFDPAVDRWDVLRQVSYAGSASGLPGGPENGLSVRSQAPAYWGAFSSWSHPCNPYGPVQPGSSVPFPSLVYRAAAAALSGLMAVTEYETLPGKSDRSNYPGYMGAMERILSVYAETAPHLRRVMSQNGLGDDVREVWAEGLRHLVDRSYADAIVSDMNQSSHYVLAYERFAQGSKDSSLHSSPVDLPFADDYVELTRLYMKRYQDIGRTWSSAGWSPESLGPDSSYAGIQNYIIGLYLRLSESDPQGQDLTAREVLRDSYNFFNLTVAEEPDGTMVSSTSMNHRMGDGFAVEQWSGARNTVTDMEVVDFWNSRVAPTDPAREASQRADLLAAAQNFDHKTKTAHLGGLDGAAEISRFYGPPPSSFPPEPTPPPDVSTEMHTFSNENYSVAIYAAHPVRNVFYIERDWPFTRHIPLERESISIEDVHPETSLPLSNGSSIDAYIGTPMAGGGITILASESMGSAILTQNWSPLVHHGLVAVMSDGLRYWEDYFKVERQPLAECASVFEAATTHDFSVYGKLEQSDICYARHYDFETDRVKVLLELHGGALTGSGVRLFENIPVPTCTRSVCVGGDKDNIKSGGASLWDAATNTLISDLTKLTSSDIDLRDDVGASILGISFRDTLGDPSVQSLTISPHGLRRFHYSTEIQVGRVEVELSTDQSSLSQLRYELVLP